VGDDAADNGYEHEHRGRARKPSAPHHRHVVELEVETVEEVTAQRVA
jgi:hypothetical protein